MVDQAPTRISVPGKLILMGEHAVVYGRPALVAAIDRRLVASLASHAADGLRLELPQLGLDERTGWRAVLDYARDARRRWEAFARSPESEPFARVRGADPAHVVKVALGEAADHLGEADPQPLALRVDSAIPIGAGLGSSSATAVAVVAGYLARRGRPLDGEILDRLVLEVERRQHGLPSGVDHRTVRLGGVLWARRRGSGAFETRPVRLASGALGRLVVVDTGAPAESTGAVVAAVRARVAAEPARYDGLFDRFEAATRALRELLADPAEDAAALVELLRGYQRYLEELGVVPEPVRELVRRVELAGGAAKVCGAGGLAGPGAGCLLVYHPRDEAPGSWSWLAGYPRQALRLGAPGLVREAQR